MFIFYYFVHFILQLTSCFCWKNSVILSLLVKTMSVPLPLIVVLRRLLDKPCAVNLLKRSRVRTDVLRIYYGCVLPGMLIIANEAISCELRP